MGSKEEMELIKYYRELYNKYVVYFSNRMWGSFEDGYGDPIGGVNNDKFKRVGHIFSMYMLRLNKAHIKPTDVLVGVFVHNQLSSVLGRGCSSLTDDEQLEGVIAVSKVLLDDIKGVVKISGLVNPLKDVEEEEDIPKVKVVVPEGCIVDVKEEWDGVTEYTVKLKNTYKIVRELSDATDSSSEGVEILTLGSSSFDKRGILSYKIKGDDRGEVVAKYWSVMFKEVLEYFKETRKEDFLDIVGREILKGQRKVFVRTYSDGMDAPKDIGDGVYIEGHTSPNQIKSLLSILFANLGLSLEDLEVCVVEGKNPKGGRRSL